MAWWNPIDYATEAGKEISSRIRGDDYDMRDPRSPYYNQAKAYVQDGRGVTAGELGPILPYARDTGSGRRGETGDDTDYRFGANRGSAPAGGGDGASRPELDQLAVNNTQRTINQIPGLLADAINTERRRYQNAIRDFGAQENRQRGVYDESTTTNQQNYDSNFMDSIRAGIQGLGGLMNVLRGTGASGGTVEDQARDVVGGVTAQDIRGGADVRQENQSELDNSLSAFLTDLERKRDVNRDTLENNRRAVSRDYNTQLQELYGKMAGLYGDADMGSQRANWMNKAGGLTPKIARNSRTQLGKYDSAPVEVQAPELTAFSGATQPNIAAPGADQSSRGQIGSGIFTMSDRQRERENERRQPAAVGV